MAANSFYPRPWSELHVQIASCDARARLARHPVRRSERPPAARPPPATRADLERVPGTSWARATPESVGYSTPRLEALRAWLKTLDTKAMFVAVHGRSTRAVSRATAAERKRDRTARFDMSFVRGHVRKPRPGSPGVIR